MSLSLLRSLHACGEALCKALAAGEPDGIDALSAERQALIDELLAAPRPSLLPAEWDELGGALTAQSRRLAELLAERQRQLSAALAQASQQRKAHDSYEAPGPPTGRMNVVHG